MKISRKIFVFFMAAAITSSAAVLFRESSPSVSLCLLSQQEYRPYLSFSGYVSAKDKKGTLEAIIQVGEGSIGKIKTGQSAEISTVAFEGKSYCAHVADIGKSAKKVSVGNAKSVVVDVRLDIDDSDGNLKPGYTAKVRIYTDEQTAVSVLPYSAVLEDEEGEYVFLYCDGKAVKTYVETGRELENGYEITHGISPEAQVIERPGDRLFDGCGVLKRGEEK